MPRELLPPDVTRILSFHGPVELRIGPVKGRAQLAPFDEVLYLLVPRCGPEELALLQHNGVDILARAADGTYDLRVHGRCVAGTGLAGHPERAAIEPWLADGTAIAPLLVCAFTPELVELNRAEGQGRARYAGATRALRDRPAQAWGRAALSGGAAAGLVSGLAVPWLHLLLQGPEVPWRGLAVLLSFCTAAALVLGLRLVVVALAFHRWRAGRARPADSPVLVDGHLAPAAVAAGGNALFFAGLLLLLLVGSAWGASLAGVVVASSLAWLLAPAWFLHLNTRKPEAMDPGSLRGAP